MINVETVSNTNLEEVKLEKFTEVLEPTIISRGFDDLYNSNSFIFHNIYSGNIFGHQELVQLRKSFYEDYYKAEGEGNWEEFEKAEARIICIERMMKSLGEFSLAA